MKGHHVARTSADVENAPLDTIDPLDRRAEAIEEIVDEEDVADLLPVPVDGDRAPHRRCNREPRDPSLVFHPELSAAVDARLSQADRPESVDSGVVPYVLIGGTFGAPVGRVKIERLRF